MKNDNINIYEDDFNEGFEDIEQLLKPQCEFKASDTLKEEVIEKAREEIAARRFINMWPWAAAACVAGVLIMFLMPPKTNVEVVEDTQIIAKVEPPVTNTTARLQPKETPEDKDVIETVVVQKQSKATSVTATAVSQPTEEAEHDEEPVQMSEETRMELLMTYLSPEEQMPMEIDQEEEIRQMRIRGERMINKMKTE